MSRPALYAHRHCMVVHAYYPLGEPRVQREAEALTQAGANVDIICLRDHNEAATQIDEGVRIYRVPVQRNKNSGVVGQLLEYWAFFALAFVRLTFLNLQCRYHVIQVHNLPDFLVFVALIPRLTGAKVILDLHDLMPEFFISRFGGDKNRLAVRLVRWQEWISCCFADHVITVTTPWQEVLVKRGLSPAKCSVVMNVADDRIFHAQPSRESLGDSMHLLYHGTLTYRYGVDLALRAVAQVREQIPNLRLTIHGRGEYLSALEQLAAGLNLDGVVTFSTQLLPIEELPKLIASADVGLVPYRRDPFTDGILPTKLMEYAALGLPTIAVRTPVIEAYFAEDMLEIFEVNDVTSLAKAIIRLSRDKQRRTELSRNIRRFNERYNWKAQRTEYLSLVSRLSKRSPHLPLNR